MIRLHNSLSRKLEDFKPIDSNRVTMYVCGATVYDTPHLGNARPAVVFDVLFRLLQHAYPLVEYARNFTDVDDKIIARSNESGEPINELTERVIREYHASMDALGVARPTYEPRVTGNMAPIKGMISELIMSGHAYVSEGHALFDVKSFPLHGSLSGHLQENLDVGHRVAVADYKRDPADFVLWKPAKEGEPAWDFPSVSSGRPGWHIECSAMIKNVFADNTIDIHGGGADLRFPHHECEMSQSHAANGHHLANYWLHNAMVTLGGSKMQKTGSHMITVDQILRNNDGASVRFALLSSHYRSPLDWSPELLENSHGTLAKWHKLLSASDAPAEANNVSTAILKPLYTDLNVPGAVGAIHNALATVTDTVAAGVRYAASVMGFDLSQEANLAFLKEPELEPQLVLEIERLLGERAVARQNKNFAESDRVRELIANMGVVVEDGPEGTTWKVK
jgi:cysteinyl-tRNA synthetase